VLPIDTHERSRHLPVRLHDATLGAAHLACKPLRQRPARPAHVIGEPDRVAQLGLQSRNRAVDLNVLRVAVLAPGIMRVDLSEARERGAQRLEQLHIVRLIARTRRRILDPDARGSQLGNRTLEGGPGAAFGNGEIDETRERHCGDRSLTRS